MIGRRKRPTWMLIGYPATDRSLHPTPGHARDHSMACAVVEQMRLDGILWWAPWLRMRLARLVVRRYELRDFEPTSRC